MTTPLSRADSAHSLARKMADARESLIADYERELRISRADAIDRVREFDTMEFAEQTLKRPHDGTDWSDLDAIAAANPELAERRWNEMVDAAREEITSGHRAADSMGQLAGEAWQRAQFIALRVELADGWQPRNGIERQLVDSMAQALVAKLHWQAKLFALDSLESPSGDERDCAPPRVTMQHAIDQAAAMVDRFDRLFMRAVRQLRDFRRYIPTVIVQNAGQVNVGESQFNVSDG